MTITESKMFEANNLSEIQQFWEDNLPEHIQALLEKVAKADWHTLKSLPDGTAWVRPYIGGEAYPSQYRKAEYTALARVGLHVRARAYADSQHIIGVEVSFDFDTSSDEGEAFVTAFLANFDMSKFAEKAAEAINLFKTLPKKYIPIGDPARFSLS
jgi:hypothetical protein